MTSETTPAVAVVSGSAEHEGGFFATRLDSAVAWSRKNSVWPLPLGLACCAIEFMATAASRYDMARFGMEVARFSPRQADLLFVAGWLTYKMAHVMTRLYDQMAEPRWVVAMGACASTGGMHRSYSVVQGIDEFVPVDVYVAGCPPRPEAVLNALIHLQQKIAGVRAPTHVRDGVAELPIARGGVGDVLGRGEMTPPVLASAAERWVEGTKPRVVGEAADGPDERRDAAPPAGCERDDARLRPFSVRWRVPLSERGEPRADPVAEVALSSWVEAAKALQGAGYDLLLDLTAVDYPDRRPRFSIAAVFMESATARRRILETRVAEDEAVPTLSKTYEAADWAERETYDLFGIPFAGHRNLTRILMPVDYEGWPLRRDFPCEGHLRFRD